MITRWAVEAMATEYTDITQLKMQFFSAAQSVALTPLKLKEFSYLIPIVAFLAPQIYYLTPGTLQASEARKRAAHESNCIMCLLVSPLYLESLDGGMMSDLIVSIILFELLDFTESQLWNWSPSWDNLQTSVPAMLSEPMTRPGTLPCGSTVNRDRTVPTG